MANFQCLYFLENFNLWIIELKRLDLPEDAATGDKFKWLLIDKQTLKISPMDFSSMDSSQQIEERFFQQGYLKFNDSTGTFIEKYNSAQHPLDRRKDFKISTALENAIIEFLTTPSTQ